MHYLGGKSKIAKRIVAAILAATGERGRFVEPFVGSGAVAAEAAPHFREVAASDAHPDLIQMWQALQLGWEPPAAGVSEQRYAALRSEAPSPLRGFAGFGASWGGKWFGGYARSAGRDHVDEARRGLIKKADRLGNASFRCGSYADTEFAPGDVIYCDPPYEGTTGYSMAFDSAAFWRWASWASLSGAAVFVSEYKAPPGWRAIWRVERTRDMKSDGVSAARVEELLFVLA